MVLYRKLAIDLADASVLLLIEHLNRGHILTTDQRDFRETPGKHASRLWT